MRYLKCSVAAAFFCLLMMGQMPHANAQATTQDTSNRAALRLIIDRYRQSLIQGPPTNLVVLKLWAATVSNDGQWPDIDYADQNRADWKVTQHLDRVKTLSRALASPASPLYNNPVIAAAALRGLDFWIAHRFHNSNWYHNEIGIPTRMRDTTILLGNRLTGERLAGALAVWHQYGHVAPGGGANTIWTAELGMEYGAYTDDGSLVDSESRIIANEIHISTGEGIQSDWSFHQHGLHLQQFHYGSPFLTDTARLGWILHDTPWAIAPEKMQMLADEVLQGGQWMVRGIRTVPGTIDRAVSRPGSMTGDLRLPAGYLRESVPQRAAELDALIARQNGKGAPLIGFRAYPRSDFTAYQRPSFGFFLKTVSMRTLPTEQSMNGENLKGQNLSCGDSYLLRDGHEYFNLQPVWNWKLIPGVTWADGAGVVRRQPFVGAISDGTVGATAMDYQFGDVNSLAALSARKFWACDGDTVVCLIGDLRTSGIPAPVHTALDQCLLRGPVTVADAEGAVQTLTSGTQPARAVRWVHHAGFAYFPLEATPVALQLGQATGSWYAINHGYSKDPVTAPVFLATLEHGVQPAGQSSGFVIAGCETPQAAAKLAAQPTWHLLRNDADCQAVRFANGDAMAAFYKPCRVTTQGKPLFQVDHPCLLLLSHGLLRAADPTQVGGIVHVMRANGNTVTITMPPGGAASAPVS